MGGAWVGAARAHGRQVRKIQDHARAARCASGAAAHVQENSSQARWRTPIGIALPAYHARAALRAARNAAPAASRRASRRRGGTARALYAWRQTAAPPLHRRRGNNASKHHQQRRRNAIGSAYRGRSLR